MAEKFKQNVRSIVFRLLLWLVNWFDFSRKMALQLCHQEEITILPKGWMMFDPALAEEIGLNPAIILQKISGWVATNTRKGRNFIDGRTWSYNSYAKWQEKEFRWLHQKTVARIIRDLENDGRLLSGQHHANPGRREKWYTTPDSGDGSQMLLWPEQSEAVGGAKRGDDSAIRESAIEGTAIGGSQSTTTTARAGIDWDALRIGVVADFFSPLWKAVSSKGKDAPPEAQTLREDEGHDELASEEAPDTARATTPPPISGRSPSPTPPSVEVETVDASEETVDTEDIPQWARNFYTGCTDDELREMARKYGGVGRLRHEMVVAKKLPGITNPVGFARTQMAKFPDRPTLLPESFTATTGLDLLDRRLGRGKYAYIEPEMSDDPDISTDGLEYIAGPYAAFIDH